MGRFLRICDAINDWVGKGSSFLVYAMTGALMWEVVARYVFNKPTSWAAELSSMLFGAFLVLGGGYVLRRDAHINMDLVYRRLSPRGQAILDLFGYYILFFIYCGLVLWHGWFGALRSWEIREVTWSNWRPPLYPLKFVIPVGAFLMLLAGVARFVRGLIVIAAGRSTK